MTELNGIRADFERLDRALLDLIAERAELAKRAAAVKAAEGRPTLDPAQEAMVIRRAAEWAREFGLPVEEVRDIFWSLVGLTRRIQLETRTADE